jgi:hypothetical protein
MNEPVLSPDLSLSRYEMILDARQVSSGRVGRLDLDVGGVWTIRCACHLHRQADFARLIRSHFDDLGTIGPAFDACDVQDRARQAGNFQPEFPIRALIQNRTV